MVHHWQSQNVKVSGVDDMVLLSKVSEDAIIENLKKRYMDDFIFTCIGPVLVSINPFKQMPYFGEKEIEIYQGAAPYENPPHIYGLADEMYRNMLIDTESQCVIISGESGAGKTVAAKYIMSYIARVSGGGPRVQEVKNVILESNPLLEAFGNAKTVRNNNSSRFGKYVEMQFSAGGQPSGGKISNFLLEKSRVTCHNSGERNFHIFYQLVTGANTEMKRDFGLTDLNYYTYLNYGVHRVEGMNDAHDFQATLKALRVMGISDADTTDILRLVAGVLHIGNIDFKEDGNYSQVSREELLDFPAFLLGISPKQLSHKLTSREFESKWGSQSESVDVTLNVKQASYARDALAKDIYARLFDYLVKKTNEAMETTTDTFEIGILDIYGFEIFDINGFEQFCINFVNEKLQQIFIELTLKAEQEEYVAENIQWTPIDYFNNAIVVEMLEGKRPPGLFLILDDICATLHGGSARADTNLQKKLSDAASNHAHFQNTTDGFAVRHYAGTVSYSVDGFCDKNRDVLFLDLIELMQTSENSLVRKIYPEEKEAAKTKTLKPRPTTGTKIRTQASRLVTRLMKCTPHYIRCIKPNETKKPRDWDHIRVKHQVEYLGLKENIRVRRAGFAYRRPFSKFLQRYAILTKETWPKWRNADEKQGVKWILSNAYIDETQYQLGRTKLFIKAPESIFMLEEARDRKFNMYARTLQRAFKKYFAKKRQETQKQEAADLLYGHKQRRSASLNRNFVGDYIGLDMKPGLAALIGKREKVFFAAVVKKYDRRFKMCRRDLIVTGKHVYLIGRESINKGPKKGQTIEVIKRKLSFDHISHISLSILQDNFVVIHTKEDYASFLEIVFKTEFLSVFNKRYTEELGHAPNIKFSNTIEFKVKKEGWGGGGTRQIKFFQNDYGCQEILKPNGKMLNVSIGPGLPSTSKPTANRTPNSKNVKYVIPKNNSQTPPSVNGSFPTSKIPSRSQYGNIAVVNAQNLPQQKNGLNGTLSRNKQTVVPTNVSRNVPPSRPAQPMMKEEKSANVKPNKLQNDKLGPIMGMFANPNNTRVGLVKAPPPPSEPAPHNQPTIHTAFRLPPFETNRNGRNETVSNQPASDTLRRPQPMPRKPPIPSLPKVKAMFDYSCQDLDELELKEGDIVEVLTEHEGGWWRGRLKGKTGLFPSNYVVKI